MAEVAATVLTAVGVVLAAIRAVEVITKRLDERDAKRGSFEGRLKSLASSGRPGSPGSRKEKRTGSTQEQLLQQLKKILQQQKQLELDAADAAEDIRKFEDVEREAIRLLDMVKNLKSFSEPIAQKERWTDKIKSTFLPQNLDEGLIDDYDAEGRRMFCRGALLYQYGRINFDALYETSVEDGFQCSYCHLDVKNASAIRLPKEVNTSGIYSDVLAASHLMAHDGSGKLEAYYRCVVCADRAAPNDFTTPASLVAHIAIHHALEPMGYIRQPIDREQLERQVEALLKKTPRKSRGSQSNDESPPPSRASSVLDSQAPDSQASAGGNSVSRPNIQTVLDPGTAANGGILTVNTDPAILGPRASRSTSSLRASSTTPVPHISNGKFQYPPEDQ